MAAAGAPDSQAVAEAVLAQWAALPKTGKPQPHEHTVLAGIALSLPADGNSCGGHASGTQLQHQAAGGGDGSGQQEQQQPQQQRPQQQQRLAVVALGTGTKCLGASKRLPGGAALNDCHAEALCRRALLRWLYGELLAAAQQAQQGTGGPGHRPLETAVLRLVPAERSESGSASASGADLFSGWRAELQPGVRLHMYVSQPPCGDASILHTGASACSHGAAAGGEAGAPAPGGGSGSSAAAGSFGRTGAKPLLKRARMEPCDGAAPPAAEQAPQQLQQAPDAQQAAPGAQQDAGLQQAGADAGAWRLPQQHEVESYAAAQATGVVRRKPGRGEATLSMACSDKLARWLLLGLQGSLLDGLLAAPLHLASITVGLPPPPPAAADGDTAAAPAAEQQPSGKADGGAAQGSEPGLAAAAEAALRRALLDRTAALTVERLPADRQPATPTLGVHSPAHSPGNGGSRAQELGLAPSAARRVAGGASVVWFAPPSAEWKWRQRHPGAPPVLSGGSGEAVAGIAGLKAGSARPKAGQPVHPSAQPAVSKATLFTQWRQLVAALQRLLYEQQQAAEVAQPTAATGTDAGPSSAAGLTYRAAKRAAGAGYQAAWARLRAPPSPLEPWIPKPPELEAFE